MNDTAQSGGTSSSAANEAGADHHHASAQQLRELARLRWRMAIAVSLIVIISYFGFVLLIAFQRSTMSILINDGLSVGIALGAAVIAITWATTWFYVRWTNKHVDGEVERLNGGPR